MKLTTKPALQMMPVDLIENYVKEIEKEKQEEAAKKKTSRGGASGTTGGATGLPSIESSS